MAFACKYSDRNQVKRGNTVADAAYLEWALSLTDKQVGVTPLASPAAALTFPFSDDSLNTTYRQLRAGDTFQLSATSGDEDAQLTTAEHWHWLLANRSDGLELQLALGFLVANRGDLRFPVFQGRLNPDPDRPLGYLQLAKDEKLNLNSTLVRLLQQKFQIPSAGLVRDEAPAVWTSMPFWRLYRKL